jgi:predicted negative regulator of RcsB-dependent stress response
MTRAVEEDCPWASPIHDRLGEVYLKLGRPQPARNAFERSLSWRPEDPVAKRGVEQAEATMKNE